MALTPESARKKRLKAMLKEEKVWFFFPANNGLGMNGIPDCIMIVEGEFWSAEVKADGGKCTALQLLRAQEIDQAGGQWYLIATDESIEELRADIRARRNSCL